MSDVSARTLSPHRLGFALGSTLGLVYAACVVVIHTVPREFAIRFFDSVLHGIDVTGIMRWEMSWPEMLVGITETFVLGWLFGLALAAFYNLGLRREG